MGEDRRLARAALQNLYERAVTYPQRRSRTSLHSTIRGPARLIEQFLLTPPQIEFQLGELPDQDMELREGGDENITRLIPIHNPPRVADVTSRPAQLPYVLSNLPSFYDRFTDMLCRTALQLTRMARYLTGTFGISYLWLKSRTDAFKVWYASGEPDWYYASPRRGWNIGRVPQSIRDRPTEAHNWGTARAPDREIRFYRASAAEFAGAILNAGDCELGFRLRLHDSPDVARLFDVQHLTYECFLRLSTEENFLNLERRRWPW